MMMTRQDELRAMVDTASGADRYIVNSPAYLVGGKLAAQAPTLATELAAALDEVERLREYFDAVEAFDSKPWQEDIIVMAQRVRDARVAIADIGPSITPKTHIINHRYDAAWPVEGKG